MTPAKGPASGEAKVLRPKIQFGAIVGAGGALVVALYDLRTRGGVDEGLMSKYRAGGWWCRPRWYRLSRYRRHPPSFKPAEAPPPLSAWGLS